MKEIHTYAQQLTTLGLSSNEALIYCYALKFSQVSIATLSRMTHIARSTLYGVVRSLIKKGLILEHKTKGTTHYSSVPFEQLITLLEQEKKDVEQRINRLQDQQEFFSSLQYNQPNRPLVTYYSPSEVMTHMYEKIVTSEMVRSIWDIEGAMNYYSMDYEQIESISRSAKGTTHRILYESDYAHQYQTDRPQEQIKFIKDKALQFSDEFMMDGVVYHGRYNHKHTGIAISDPNYFEIQCLLFDRLRESI